LAIFGLVFINFMVIYGLEYTNIYIVVEISQSLLTLSQRKGEYMEETKKPSKEKLKVKKDSKEDKIKELTDDLQRLQAEFSNYQKRIDKEKSEFVKYSKGSMINELLPLLDTFEIALKNSKDSAKFLKGMEMVYSQFFSLLEKEGLRPIPAIGKKYDPHLHDVMLKEKSDKEDDIIIEELQKGYFLKDKVLRHSKVKISKK
jgi:molecular chaperone GrpE